MLIIYFHLGRRYTKKREKQTNEKTRRDIHAEKNEIKKNVFFFRHYRHLSIDPIERFRIE